MNGMMTTNRLMNDALSNLESVCEGANILEFKSLCIEGDDKAAFLSFLKYELKDTCAALRRLNITSDVEIKEELDCTIKRAIAQFPYIKGFARDGLL